MRWDFSDPVVRLVHSAMLRKWISSDDIASQIHVHPTTFLFRMRDPSTFKLDELRLLAKALGTDIGDLVRGLREDDPAWVESEWRFKHDRKRMVESRHAEGSGDLRRVRV